MAAARLAELREGMSAYSAVVVGSSETDLDGEREDIRNQVRCSTEAGKRDVLSWRVC